MRTEIQKITVNLPKNLLDEAKKITGLGISDTLKSGLENIIKNKTNKKLIELRGKYKFALDLNKLRIDNN